MIGDPDTPEVQWIWHQKDSFVYSKECNIGLKVVLHKQVNQKRGNILNTLRSLEKSEAEFLLAIKEKTMPFKSVTKEICELAGFELSPK